MTQKTQKKLSALLRVRKRRAGGAGAKGVTNMGARGKRVIRTISKGAAGKRGGKAVALSPAAISAKAGAEFFDQEESGPMTRKRARQCRGASKRVALYELGSTYANQVYRLVEGSLSPPSTPCMPSPSCHSSETTEHIKGTHSVSVCRGDRASSFASDASREAMDARKRGADEATSVGAGISSGPLSAAKAAASEERTAVHASAGPSRASSPSPTPPQPTARDVNDFLSRCERLNAKKREAFSEKWNFDLVNDKPIRGAIRWRAVMGGKA